MKRYSKIISFTILIALGFLFLHSELDIFTPEHHHHTAHDFCDLVNEAKTENSNPDFIKILMTDFFDITLSDHLIVLSDIKILYKTYSVKKEPDTRYNIFYSTFLI